MTLGTRVIDWDFIVAEIGEDEANTRVPFISPLCLEEGRRIWVSAYHVPFSWSQRSEP